MDQIKFYSGEQIPLEMHKAKIVRNLKLLPIEERLNSITEAGNNTFLLQNKDVYLDMLTDSGVNAMSDRQQAAMLLADDSYAGSETFTKLKNKLKEIFDMDYFLPVHQGRAAENIIAKTYVRPDSVVPMNYHFTTTKAHITLNGGVVEELIIDEGLKVKSDHPFKGNMDTYKLKNLIKTCGAGKIPFVRMEAGTNLIGGQPFSLENLREISNVCDEHRLMLVLDASLLADNLYFIKQKELACQNMSIHEITLEIASLCDIIYFSARKLGCARGGGIAIKDKSVYDDMRELIPLYEGFLTYGGMSVMEMEAITVGLEETMDENFICQGPLFITFLVEELSKRGIPVVTPAGGLGGHIDAMEFLDHVPQSQYPSGALAAALYIAGGIRGMERGTMSEQRNPDGSEAYSNMELLRLAVPRRVFTLSQIKYVIDRVTWLYENRKMVEGLAFTEEPDTLRFFFGRLEPVSSWQEKLVEKFRKDFGDSL